MSLLITVLSFCVAITIIVFVHELGHFFTAKRAGIGVKDFSIGFGKPIFQRRVGETTYSLRPIPLGGFVDLEGMDPTDAEVPPERSFSYKNTTYRMVVLFAGSFMNFVLAFALFWGLNAFSNVIRPAYLEAPLVAQVAAGSPAALAGLHEEDRIVAVEGRKLSQDGPYVSLAPLAAAFRDKAGAPVALTVLRESAEITLAVPPDTEKRYGRMRGLTPAHPAFVSEVFRDSPEGKAGLRENDRVLAVDGQKVEHWHQVNRIVARDYSEGRDVTLTVHRETVEVAVTFRPLSDELVVAHALRAVIGDVQPGLPASDAGFRKDDTVLAIASEPVHTWNQMVRIVGGYAGRPVEFELLGADGQTRKAKVTPKPLGPKGEGKVGIYPQQVLDDPIGLVEGGKAALFQVVDMTQKTLRGIADLFRGALSFDNASGPVGIADFVGKQAQKGLVSFIMVTALLSLNIGILNLLPFPGLDGARMLFVAIEIVIRRRVVPKVEEVVHTLGILILIGLAILITYHDILKLFRTH